MERKEELLQDLKEKMKTAPSDTLKNAIANKIKKIEGHNTIVK